MGGGYSAQTFANLKDVTSLQKCVARGVLQMPWDRKVSDGSTKGLPREPEHESRLNHAVKGAHVVIPFQCEECWMLNQEGRQPLDKLDDTYKMLIRRANLDAIAG